MGARSLVLLLFFLSGAAGLVYEVVWTRQLSLVFGVTVFAASAVLAAFMGGLALGSWWAGRFIDRHPNPVRFYAWLEAGVGLSALALPFVLEALVPAYVAVARALEGRFLLFNLARALLVALPLLVPTTLMGATVPAIGRYLVSSQEQLGWNVGLLYAINTFGAVLGCLLAGFALIPSLGLATTTQVAVAINLGIAALLLLGRVGETRGAPAPAAPPAARAPLSPAARLAVAVFAASGFVALGYPRLWTRALVVYVHNTSYAFSIMLAMFLLGLVLGDAIGMRVYDRIRRPLLWLGGLEALIGLSVLLAAAAYGALPTLSRALLDLESLTGFGDALALMAVRAGLVLLPSTILLGMVFPLVARAVCGGLAGVGRDLGVAYAANTGGAIAGALATAFGLIPLLGLHGTLVALAAVNLLLGAVCLMAEVPAGPRRLAVAAAGIAVAALPALAIPRTVFYDALEGGGWKLVYYHEGVTDTTGVWEHEALGQRVVTYGDQRGTAGTMTDSLNRRQAHIAHLLHPQPRRSLQIGFGVGNTLAAAALYPEVEQLDCVELSPHVRETAPFFWTNADVLADPKVELVVDDGRNYLLRTDTTYDVITLEPPEIFTADVVNLYTVEFYRLARDALAEDGLMAQWLPTYTMSERDARMLVRAMLEVFPETSLWYQGRWTEFFGNPMSTLVLIGAKQPIEIEVAALGRRMAHPALREDLRRLGLGSPGSFLSHFVAGPERVREWIGDAPPVTDDRTIVDYSTPLQVFSGFGFGALRFHEGFEGPLRGLDEHMVAILGMYQRLREPAERLLASPPSEALRQEIEMRRRRFDKGVRTWKRQLVERPSSAERRRD